ncbi:MAG: single-stranded DNA-binding protein [Parcubacteria group bacterium]|nr:single-stranded DNA-binding protein [Parcubacteria group bacterium]
MNLNKVFLIGNLTRDVTLKTTPSGQSVAEFGVATNRVWTGANGQKQQEVEFHNIVVWGKMAELCNQYLAKGRMVFIEGRIRTRSWQDASNQKRYRTEIIAENIQFGPKSMKEETKLDIPPETESFSHEDLPVLEEETEEKDSDDVSSEDIPF